MFVSFRMVFCGSPMLLFLFRIMVFLIQPRLHRARPLWYGASGKLITHILPAEMKLMLLSMAEVMRKSSSLSLGKYNFTTTCLCFIVQLFLQRHTCLYCSAMLNYFYFTLCFKLWRAEYLTLIYQAGGLYRKILTRSWGESEINKFCTCDPGSVISPININNINFSLKKFKRAVKAMIDAQCQISNSVNKFIKLTLNSNNDK